jgi:hypothetical protein
MFGLGAGGFIHEVLIGVTERPFVLALCGTLMGLPFVISADRRISQPPKQEDRE